MSRTLQVEVVPLVLLVRLHLRWSKRILARNQVPPVLVELLLLRLQWCKPMAELFPGPLHLALPPELQELWLPLLLLLLEERWVDYGGNRTYPLRLNQTRFSESISHVYKWPKTD
jgi:hypothetical protein